MLINVLSVSLHSTVSLMLMVPNVSVMKDSLWLIMNVLRFLMVSISKMVKQFNVKLDAYHAQHLLTVRAVMMDIS